MSEPRYNLVDMRNVEAEAVPLDGELAARYGLVLDPSGDSKHLRGLADLCDRKARLAEQGLNGYTKEQGLRFRRLARHYRESADEREAISS